MRLLSRANINHFFSSSRRKVLTFTLLSLTAGAGCITALATNQVDAASSSDSNNTQLVVARLNALQTQMTSLQEAVNASKPAINLDDITRQIEQISQDLDQLKAANAEQWSETLTKNLSHTESTLGVQLASIKEAVNQIDKKQNKTVYLKPESLPFKVISLDSIQQVAVASVVYDFKTVPLEKGDGIAGWKVVSLDYGKQRLELENKKGERAVVTSEHIG